MLQFGACQHHAVCSKGVSIDVTANKLPGILGVFALFVFILHVRVQQAHA
jgi:hypothetical protein